MESPWIIEFDNPEKSFKFDFPVSSFLALEIYKSKIEGILKSDKPMILDIRYPGTKSFTFIPGDLIRGSKIRFISKDKS